MNDLTATTDEELDQLRVDVITEQERRANLAAIPEQVAALARAYREGGGNPAQLEDAIQVDPRA